MSHNPNTVKSQDSLIDCNEGKRKSDVLLASIERCERLQKQLDIAVQVLEKYANRDFEEYNPYIWDRGNEARKALICIKVQELKK